MGKKNTEKKYLCQMLSGYLSHGDCGKIKINVIFSEICDSELTGMQHFLCDCEEFDEIDTEDYWLCENNDNCNDDKCCKDRRGIRFKHTHTKECSCLCDEGTYYYTQVNKLSDKIIKEYIENGYLSDESLRLFVEDKMNDDDYTSSLVWVCTKLD